MPLIHCDFFSEALRVGTSMTVILPQPASAAQIGVTGSQPQATGHGHPTLYLLHGLSDDHTIWTRRTSIERYVAPLGLAVVMPRVDRSYYADMAHGSAYWTFISDELPRLCRQMFHLSSRREDNFVAGLSMGGYGAFKLATNFPDRFAAAASLSGALDPQQLIEQMQDRASEWTAIFGDPLNIKGTVSDLYDTARSLAAGQWRDMPLYQCCGTADFLYQDNLRFRDHATALGLSLTCEADDGDTHEWGYWDRKIQNVLRWLPLPANAGPQVG